MQQHGPPMSSTESIKQLKKQLLFHNMLITVNNTRCSTALLHKDSFSKLHFIMSHWKNFPASSNMTDFEIVVVQNERARWEREAKEQNSKEDIPEQDDDDALVTNILTRVDPIPMPIPLTPIHPTPSPTPTEATLSESEQDEVEEVLINVDNIVNQCDSQGLDTQTPQNNESNDSSSSGSYQSVQSTNTPTKTVPIIGEDQNNQVNYLPILFHGNDTIFMKDINKMNVNKKRRTILISAVRPSFHCSHNEFFICHVCHKKSRQIKMVDELWEMAKDNDDANLGDEQPFAYNLRGIIDHLTNHHCLTHEDKSRDMIVAVANYIDMVNKDIEDGTSPMFYFDESIPKASSTSCLRVSWKTDQPELTMDLAHSYNFRNHANYSCKGHTKLVDPKCLEYELDLANSVYCSCNAPTIDLTKVDQPSRPVAQEIFDMTLNIFQENTFFNQERKSIHQSHKAILCHFKIPQAWPKFPTKTYKPSKPITRGDTKERLLQESQQDNSAGTTTSSSSHASPEQQNLPKNSCKMPPPGELRLRPEGSSPPMPPSPREAQPPLGEPAGKSVKAKVGHAVATAASLLRGPARKSDYV